MDETDNRSDLLLLEQQIVEVEMRLGMLRDQMVAMFGEGDATGEQSELMHSALRALHSLNLLRHEIWGDSVQPACNDGNPVCVSLLARPPENQATL